MRIIRHHAKKSAAASPRTRNDYLINEQQKDHRLSVLGTSLRRLSLLALSYKCKLDAKRCRARELQDKLVHAAAKGDVQTICRDLSQAYASGKLEGKDALLAFIKRLSAFGSFGFVE